MPTMIRTKRGLNLTLKQAEYIYSSLDLNENAESLDEQRYVRLQVSQIYESGTEDVNKNPWKAKKYLAEATAASQVKHGFFSSETVFTILGFYTAIRVQISRINTLLKHSYIAKAFLNRMFGIAGLSYLIELFYDLYLTTKSAYQSMPSETAEEKQASRFHRFFFRCKIFIKHFQNALEEEEGRKNRMVNCAVWFSVNLTLFIVTFAWSFLLNIGGFFIDVFNVYHKRSNIVKMHENLLTQISNKVTETADPELELYRKCSQLTEMRRELQNQLITTFDFEEREKIRNHLLILQTEMENNAKEIASNKTDLERFEYERTQIAQKTNEAKKERNKALAIVMFVLITVILSSPIPGLNLGIMAAAAIALVSVTAYVTLTRLWEIGKKIGKFLLKTYENYKSHKAEMEKIANNHTAAPLHTLVSTETVKRHLRENITFLKSCKEKAKTSCSLAETFAKFTPAEILKLRKIFNLKKDEAWQKQLKHIIEHNKIEHDKNEQKTTPEQLQNRFFYRCSFKHLLDHRIAEEREFGFSLDSDPNTIQTRLDDLEQETDPLKYEFVTNEPAMEQKYQF